MRKFYFVILFIFLCSFLCIAQKTVQYKVGGISFEMIELSGGTFTMGATEEQLSDADDNEKPVHSVTLNSFALGAKEVTQELWVTVMGDNPSLFQGNNSRPVESVSYNDCLLFISRLNDLTGNTFRLPTEAEWEFAARGANMGGNDKKYCGRTSPGLCAKDNGTGTEYAGYASNQLGLGGMSGNVWEWCSDWYGPYSLENQTNPKGPSKGVERVCRGGGWGDPEWKCRSSSRQGFAPDYSSGDLGFRLAMSIIGKGQTCQDPTAKVTTTLDSGRNALEIKYIALTKDDTQVFMRYYNKRKFVGGVAGTLGLWASLLNGGDITSSDLLNVQSPVIQDRDTKKEYKLLHASGIAVYPNKTETAYESSRDFVLYFPPIPESVSTIDIVDAKWSCNGFIIKRSSKPSENVKQPASVKQPVSEEKTKDITNADNTVSFSMVEVKPSFQGGSANEFSKWVNQRLRYPEESKKNRSEGRVILKFLVDLDGSVCDVRVLRSSGDPLLDAEAVRVISMSPAWTPGKQKDRPVRVTYTFPVIFKLN
jgi:TonB family protein